MALKSFVTAAGATFTVGDNSSEVIGGTGNQTVRIQGNVTGASGFVREVALDANIERIELRGALSDYKFVVISGTGLEIQNATSTYGSIGSVVASLANINQNVTLAFSNGSAMLAQTDSNVFTLGVDQQTIPVAITIPVDVTENAVALTPTLNGVDTSTVTYTSGTANTPASSGGVSKSFVTSSSTFTVADKLVKVLAADAGSEVVRIQAGVTDVTLDANIERIELSAALATYKFLATSGIGLRIYESNGTTLVATIPSINQNVEIAFTDGSAVLAQTAATAFTLGGQTVHVAATGATTLAATLDRTANEHSELGLVVTDATGNVTNIGNVFDSYGATSGTSGNVATVVATDMTNDKVAVLAAKVAKIANDGITGSIGLDGTQFGTLTNKLNASATLTVVTDTTLAATVLTAMDTKADPTVVATGVSTITGSATNVASVANATGIQKAGNFAVTLSGTNATGTELKDINAATIGLVDALSVTTVTGFAAADYLDIGGASATGDNVKTNAGVEITLTDTATTGAALKHLNSKTTGLVNASVVSAITVFDAADYLDIGGNGVTGNTVNTKADVTIALTDTTTTGAALKHLNSKTTGLVDASAVTAITVFDAADYLDIGGASATGDNVKTKGDVTITLTNTTTTGAALKALNLATTGLVDASAVTAITVLDALDFALVGGTSGSEVKTKSDVAVTLSNATLTMTGANLKTLNDATLGLVDASTLTSITALAAVDFALVGGIGGTAVKTNAAVAVTFSDSISAANVNTVDGLTTGLVTATVTADAAATVNTALADAIDVDALTITVTDTSVDATVLKALDSKTSVNIIDSSTIATLTGSTVADFVTVLTAGATAGLAGTEAATVTGTISATEADSIAALTSGIVTATVTTGSASALNTALATTYNGNDKLSLTLDDTTGTTITLLDSLDGKTAEPVVATTLTEVLGTSGADAIDLTDTGITYHATAMISIKGGAGDDTLTGRADAGDTFVIESGADNQVITILDFNGTNDSLSFFSDAILNVVLDEVGTPDGDDADGIQRIEATNATNSATTIVELRGLTAAQDANLFNMASFNTLFAKTGRAGDDIINGTAGIDTMTGGAGNDKFVFASGGGNNTTTIDEIVDFASGDTISVGVSGSVTNYAEIAAADYGKATTLAELVAAADSLMDGLVKFVIAENGTTDAANEGGTGVSAVATTASYLIVDWNGDGTSDQAILLAGVTDVTNAAITNAILVV
jgi:hypothetical protein